MIRISTGEKPLAECESVIIIPEKAIEEAGYIQVYTAKDSANAKHEYHAMAQMAYFQYQDEELEIFEINSPMKVEVVGVEEITVEAGMVIIRKQDNEFAVYMHADVRKKKLLESAYRYCTRWVRLDI